MRQSFGPTADLEVQKNQAMEDIRADENLNETEKAAAISDIENEFTALAQFEPLPGNVEAVRPFLDRIRDAGVGGIGEPDDE